MASWVVPLTAVGAGDVGLVGGKGANLGELLRAGFAVPAGFVVTTRADTLPEPVEGPRRGRLTLPDAIQGTTIPPDLATSIVDAYRALGEGPVAVRSSATAEDLPGAASAGQQDTSLNVVGPQALLDAVRRCWASLWGERAVAYRARLGYADVPEIAVVVQRMVPSEHAGVLFTADPVTGARDRVVIEASPGLGEAVVSGLVTPEHVVVDRHGRLVERRPGRHEVVIHPRAGGGVAEERVADGEVDALPAGTLRDLAATGSRVAAHSGRPQAIE